MDHFAGLDVSVKETSVCIVDETGKVVREVKVASEPEALLAVLKNPAYHFTRIGLEAGPLSQWLFSALAEAELPVVCVETRHMQAVLKAQINKTDRNDARGIAQMMRVGLYRPVHVKTLRSQKLRMLLTHRKLLQSKAIAIENDLRGTLRNFGLKVGMVGKVKFETRIKELLENLPDLAELVEPLLIVRRTLSEQIVILHRRLLDGGAGARAWLEEATWRRVIDVNLTGVFLVAQAAARIMIPQGGGSIVNTTSMYGVAAAPGRASYCASKAGVVGLTKVLAIEWAASAVRVNAIGPGYVRTALTEQAEAEGKLDFNALVRRVPVGRLATPAEIADIALFLASDAAAYITGQTLVADGGWTSYSYL